MVANWDETAVKLKCRKNHWEYENKQYTIEKSIESANRNAKIKFQNFQNLFVFRAFLEKVVFSNLKPVNIFEWNFQEGFLIDIHWKWRSSG